MKLLLFAVPLLLLLSGCCLAGPSCHTYSESCKKTCNGLPECEADCKATLQGQGGIDPDSCCPKEMTVRGAAEVFCTTEAGFEDEEYFSHQECVDNAVAEYQYDFGIGPDECIVGA